MKNVEFVVNGDNKSVNGMLIIGDSKTSIFLNDTIGGHSYYDIDAKSIEDVGNFIAAFIKRIDKDALFESITLCEENKNFIIMRESPDNHITRLYRKAVEDGDDTILDKPTVSFKDIYGKLCVIDVTTLGFEPVDVPDQFKYTKNPVLNHLYQRALLPHDYNRKMNVVITKEISKRKKNSNSKPWAFWCSSTARVLGENWKGNGNNDVYVSSDLVAHAEAFSQAE